MNLVFLTALVFISLVWIGRIIRAHRLLKTHPPLLPVMEKSACQALVSIIIPARNEEKNISRCVESFFRQTYPHCELIVVDDRSTDNTPRLLERLKEKSPFPFKIIRIEKLPEGWTGKNYAVFTGSRAAHGAWFLFTDADTTHQPQSVQTSLECCLRQNIDFLTLAPQVEAKSFWEQTVQPLVISSMAVWFDPQKINDSKNACVLANGQYLLIKKEVYEAVGGNESVKNQVVEDVELAKKIKTAGFNLKFLDGTLLYSTRMYTNLKEIKTGWTRILLYLFDKRVDLILHKIFLFLFFSILPFGVLAAQIFLKAAGSVLFDPLLFWVSGALCALIISVRFVANRMIKSSPWYAFLHPLGSLVMVWILSVCLTRILLGRKSVWKGQAYA
jgi:chlorobactene glucosyltransferase